MTKEVKILIGIAIVVVIGGVLLAIYANPQKETPGAAVDKDSLVRETSHMTGKKDAKVTIVEFGDYQCPACAAAHPQIKSVLEKYKDNTDVNFVFRNFPLETIHPNARISSEAAEAAGTQGKYWEMHDKLYENQDEWASSQTPMDMFIKYATEIGLNVNDFKISVEQRLHADVIDTDLKDGAAASVNSTPTIFINGTKTSGYQGDELIKAIDEALAK